MGVGVAVAVGVAGRASTLPSAPVCVSIFEPDHLWKSALASPAAAATLSQMRWAALLRVRTGQI